MHSVGEAKLVNSGARAKFIAWTKRKKFLQDEGITSHKLHPYMTLAL